MFAYKPRFIAASTLIFFTLFFSRLDARTINSIVNDYLIDVSPDQPHLIHVYAISIKEMLTQNVHGYQSSGTLQIDVSNWPPGDYHFQYLNGMHSASMKFILPGR
jgi:hypothetical protein